MRWFFALFLCLASCVSVEELQKKQIKERNERKDLIHRRSYETLRFSTTLVPQVRDPYPWESGYTGGHPPITKEVFRCRGSDKNPPKMKAGGGHCSDCAGKRTHSLPIRGDKEFVYPILLDLLNYVQSKTGRPVVVTSGHRCPQHHSYVDSSVYQETSKHQIGAEVDFYVEGMEDKPEEVISLLMSYYKSQEWYRGRKEYETFLRLETGKLDVSTFPWYNKEVLIKLYQSHEGRNGDNAHKCPYIAVQVRFDREKNERVLYSWERAKQGYQRY